MKGLSDSVLNSLWRKAVLKKYNGRCFFCGKSEILEAHHINKRKHLTTRWDYRNGVAVCKFGCHEFGASKTGEAKIREHIGDEVYFELDRLARTTIKDYCAKEGITKNEFKAEKKKELQEVINGR